jgi:methylenetetrahydrofolate--tRNA-(uracil-5-)-methyltransferase
VRLKAEPRLRFAGQITGVEGYVESAAIGLLAGRFAAAERKGEPPVPPPATTALGALLAHITGGHLVDANGGAVTSFQPMNINYGLLPPLDENPVANADGRRLKGRERGTEKKRLMSRRALADLDGWLAVPANAA